MLITLRGHHLLCIQGYQGYGYSEKFTDNMDNIIEDLIKEGFLNKEQTICKNGSKIEIKDQMAIIVK